MQSGGTQRGGVWLRSSAAISSATVLDAPAPAPVQPPPQLRTLGWALRRAALGMLILLTVAGLTAWLLYATIDEPDGTTGPGARNVYALPSG